MSRYTESIEKLIESLIKFPGVGRRSAERIVNYIISAPRLEIQALIEALSKTKNNVRFCSVCNNLSEEDLCRVCKDERRLKDTICIVGKPSDVTAIEKAGTYHGHYHVLLGSISPLEGRGPGDLKIEGLLERVKRNQIKEVIIATDADTEGEITAIYLTKLLKPLGVQITRIGLGLPVGSNLEYADSATLAMAIGSRREI